jgi:hypothetical protein
MNTYIPPVLVHCQQRKRWELTRVLDVLGVDFSTTHIEYAIEESASWRTCPLPEFSDDATALDGLTEFVATVYQRVVDSANTVKPIVKETWRTLLTDAEHDPVIRLLIRESLSNGKQVGLIPEGAQSRMTGEVFPYFSSIYVVGSGATRFTLNEVHQEDATFLGDKGILTGYLGDTRRPVRTLGWLPRLIRTVAAIGNYRGVATVNFEYGYQWDIVRAGDETAELHLRSVRNAINILQRDHWLVLVSSKTGQYIRASRSYLGGKGVWFFKRVPWQILAKSSDVVIQRDSGIGHESLVLGIPVIVWNDFRYPEASIDLPDDPSRGVWRADCDSKLSRALNEVKMTSVTFDWDRISVEARIRRIGAWLRGQTVG